MLLVVGVLKQWIMDLLLLMELIIVSYMRVRAPSLSLVMPNKPVFIAQAYL